MEYVLLVIVIILLLVSPRTNEMLSGDRTTEAPLPPKSLPKTCAPPPPPGRKEPK